MKMILSETLEAVKISMNEIFASKNIGLSQTKGLNDNLDVVIAALKAQEKPPVKSPVRPVVPAGINIQIKK
jgi:hypothetical protein